ncbi:MAG: type II toxin-antitoxin system VapC family toxin [Spirochaetales bacterium]|nr:type II toxin-antitoxin system VapC family toxin [Spirochaetales bacterium]
MRILVDTNRYRDFCENIPEALEVFQRAEQIAVPFVALAELRAGFMAGNRGKENERVLNSFLNRRRVLVLLADEQTTFHYARLFFQLRSQGTMIPVHDIWIAALAVQHNLPLFSRDGNFEHLPQITRL